MRISANGRYGTMGHSGWGFSPTVFQLKAMLFHAGILADRGMELSRLNPREDEWSLREPFPNR